MDTDPAKDGWLTKQYRKDYNCDDSSVSPGLSESRLQEGQDDIGSTIEVQNHNILDSQFPIAEKSGGMSPVNLQIQNTKAQNDESQTAFFAKHSANPVYDNSDGDSGVWQQMSSLCPAKGCGSEGQ